MTEKQKVYKICNDIVWAIKYDNLKPEIKATILILIDEILKDNPFDVIKLQYWQEVKKEIEKL
jgi:hypothetical protein